MNRAQPVGFKRFIRKCARVIIVLAFITLVPWTTSTRYSFLVTYKDWYLNAISGSLVYERSPFVRAYNSARRQPIRSRPLLSSSRPLPQAPGDEFFTSVVATRTGWGWRLSDFESSGRGVVRAVLPFWMLELMLLSAAGLLWLASRPRSRRGFCSTCGYDLRGNVSGRCPECGDPVERMSRPVEIPVAVTDPRSGPTIRL